MTPLIEQQAQEAAARVNPEVTAEMGIGSIVSIFQQVFAFLLACKNRETPDPAEVQRAVGEEFDSNPRKLRRRTARRIRANADQPMTKSQSFALADAAIEQALSVDGSVVEQCAAAVPADLVLEE